MGFFSSLRATLPLFLLFFFFSPPVLLKSCPYFTGNTNSVPLDRGVTLTLWAGNYGNLAQCVRNAFEEAVRCHTKFKISNFRIFTNHNPLFLGFDFADVDRTLVDDLDYRCHNNDNGKCDHFFYHFQRPSLSLNQTLAVWECMGDSLNIDEIGTCPNMKNKLLIHIRNGDSFTHNNYLQPPFSSLLTTIYAKKWEQLVVMSSETAPFSKLSGPILDLLYALKVFFPQETFFPPALAYEDHLKYWLCAKNLVTPFSTLNSALPVHRHLETLFTTDIDCFQPSLPFLKSYQQYSAPTSLAQFFYDKNNKRYFAPYNEDLIAKYALTPTEPYALCPSSRTSKVEKVLFQERNRILSRPDFRKDQDLSDSLVIDFETVVTDFRIPYCGVFGAIMNQEWDRVVVLEDPTIAQTKLTDQLRNDAKNSRPNLKLLNKVLLYEGIKMLIGSVPVRFDFFPLEFRDQLKIVNLATPITSRQASHPNQPLLKRVFDISGRGCVSQKWIQFESYALHVTKTKKTTFKEHQSDILFTQCLTNYQKCNASEAADDSGFFTNVGRYFHL